jgi:RNA polymerase sigma-70 factor (ECF subfamily)
VSEPQDGAALVRAARRGDAQALDSLIRRHHERLLRLAKARVGPGVKARLRPSDVLQSTYLEIVRRFDQFRGEGDAAFLAWAGTVMDGTLKDRARYLGAAKRRGEQAAGDSDRALPAKTPTPSAEAAWSEESEAAARARARLPEDQRRILELCVDQGLSHREAAPLLNRAEGATRALLCRARAALLVEMRRGLPKGRNASR